MRRSGVRSHDKAIAAMNPTAIAVMLGIAVGAVSLVVFATVDGHPLLLASMVAVFVAMFVRWG